MPDFVSKDYMSYCKTIYPGLLPTNNTIMSAPMVSREQYFLWENFPV